MSSNSRYLDARCVVSDLSTKVRESKRVTKRKQVVPSRTAEALNPLSKENDELFRAMMSGEDSVNGLKSRDLRKCLARSISFGHSGLGAILQEP